jgi:phytoene/squalene synthetase
MSSIDHYENFPVASWLCPAQLRPAVVAIYHFARTADDMADEGDADAHSRLAGLSAMQADLLACTTSGHVSAPQMFKIGLLVNVAAFIVLIAWMTLMS